MRISDWSSDVCSSDLRPQTIAARQRLPEWRACPCWSAHPARSAVSWEHGHRPSRRLEAQEHQRWRARFHPLSYALGCSRSEEHTSELQSLMRISYAVFCLKKKKKTQTAAESTHTE